MNYVIMLTFKKYVFLNVKVALVYSVDLYLFKRRANSFDVIYTYIHIIR